MPDDDAVPNATARVFTVTSATDRGPGSLREAVERANTADGEARIEFAIAGGPTTIRLASPLPPINFHGLIDGWTQPGYAAAPLVELSGADVDAGNGLEIVGGGLTVRGLAVTSWPGHGIFLHACSDVELLGLHVGVGLDGEQPAGNVADGIHAVDAPRCSVGGPAQDTVVISGNQGHGIWIKEGAVDFRVRGSLIGVGRDGHAPLPNARSGIKVEQARAAWIGGSERGEGNVVAGNRLYGVEIGGPRARDAVVIGNLIGTDASGLAALPNGRSGLLVYNTPRVRIGGASAREANVISGGERAGVNLDGSVATVDPYDYAGRGNATGIVIQGNLIGVDKTGERPLGNRLRGILITYAQDNAIIDNVISANGEDGILILGPDDDSDPNLVPSGNRILRNRIGVTRSGAPCGNRRHGVLVWNGSNNHIGSDDSRDANMISGNEGRGVHFSGLGARTNVLSPLNDLTDNGQGEFHQPRE